MPNGLRALPHAILLAAVVMACALLMFHAPGNSDVSVWLSYMETVRHDGFVTGYALPKTDYPPLFSVLLYLGGALGARFFPGPDEGFLGLKLLIMLFWLGSAGAYWRLAGPRTYRLNDTILTAGCLLLPSVALGYVDVLFAPSFFLAITFLRSAAQAGKKTVTLRSLAFFGLFYSLTIFIKWLPILTAPFVAVYFLTRAFDFPRLAAWGYQRRDTPEGRDEARLVFWVTFLFAAGLFFIYGVPIALSLYRAAHHMALSAQAFNFNWILQYLLLHWRPDAYHFVEVPPGGWDFHLAVRDEGGEGWILWGPGTVIAALTRLNFFGHYFWCLWRYFLKGLGVFDLLLYALVGLLSYFTLNLGVHENHLFVCLLLASSLMAIQPQWRGVFLLWAALANVNLVAIYGIAGTGLGFSRMTGVDVTLLFSLLEVVSFYVLFVKVTILAHPFTFSRVTSGESVAWI